MKVEIRIEELRRMVSAYSDTHSSGNDLVSLSFEHNLFKLKTVREEDYQPIFTLTKDYSGDVDATKEQT